MTRLEMAQALRAHDNYIILTHRRPDGDTLGSAAGLCLGLRALGKNAWVLKNRQLTPKLAPFTEGLVTDTCPEHATVLSVDIASLGLLSFDAAELGLGDQIALAIDHHGSNDLNAPKLVEADRAACGEIILELLELLGVTLTEKLANALYLAISTDTGCFKYSNTTAHTHEAAAKLIHAGADTYPINKAFFDTKSFARLRLEKITTPPISAGPLAAADMRRRQARPFQAALQAPDTRSCLFLPSAGSSGSAEYGKRNFDCRQARRLDESGCSCEAARRVPRKARRARRNAGPDGDGGSSHFHRQSHARSRIF